MQETLNDAKEEFNKKFEEKTRATKKVFSFGSSNNNVNSIQEENQINNFTEEIEFNETINEEELV